MTDREISQLPVVTIEMPHSKYTIKFPENHEYLYRVFRGSDDITDSVCNNVTLDLVLEVVRLREEVSELKDLLS